jgi:hypothetical protein
MSDPKTYTYEPFTSVDVGTETVGELIDGRPWWADIAFFVAGAIAAVLGALAGSIGA